jgi:hypothetical protein
MDNNDPPPSPKMAAIVAVKKENAPKNKPRKEKDSRKC